MGHSPKLLAGFLFLSQVGGFAQVVKWTDPGNYDHAGHNAKTPPYPLSEGPMNPTYTAARIHPDITASVGGLAWLPNGDLLLLDFGTLRKNSGALQILKNVTDASQAVTTETILQGLDDPMGVQVVNGVIYVSDQKGIWRVEKSATSSYSKSLLSPRPIAARTANFPLAFNLEHKDGFLYYSMGAW
ncbi:MAG: hypothetical protein ABIW76_03845, partial [Fibrobacteria bacterium]